MSAKSRLIPRFIRETQAYHWLRRAWRTRFREDKTDPFLAFAPPGHFYSPLPDLHLVERESERLFSQDVTDVPGIDLNTVRQLALLESLARFYADLPFGDQPSSGLRYHFDNPFFRYTDGLALYGILRHYQPSRVIEIGSGFSSALMLDVNDLFLSRTIAFTFIEPFPDRLSSLTTEEDRTRHHLIAAPVQHVPLERFESLQANDILFIDSSHVAKVGSDVVHLLTDVVPRLNAGVLVHFHDIFWPFEYPEAWIRQGRAWNEGYMLKAFLQFNSHFEILLFNSYLGAHHKNALERCLPLALKDSGGSLWILKAS